MDNQKPAILIVDDEVPICDLLREDLSGHGYECKMAHSARQALELIAAQGFTAALLDIRLPEISGIDLLKQINSNHPEIACIMLTAVNDLNVAVEAMKAGAVDYITKPFDLERVEKAVSTALENKNHSKVGLNGEVHDNKMPEIEAIAMGVEARQDMLDVHSERVVQQTIGIARQMGFSEDKIQKWVAARSEVQSKKVKQITDSICNLG